MIVNTSHSCWLLETIVEASISIHKNLQWKWRSGGQSLKEVPARQNGNERELRNFCIKLIRAEVDITRSLSVVKSCDSHNNPFIHRQLTSFYGVVVRIPSLSNSNNLFNFQSRRRTLLFDFISSSQTYVWK